MSRSVDSPEIRADGRQELADYERIHKQWLTALPHITKISTSFALREVIDRAGVGLAPEMG